MSVDALLMTRRLSRPLPPEREPIVSNVRLAMAVVIMAETMFFAGLVGGYLVFRLSATQWPPPSLPRLPILLTSLNSLVLFASVVPLWRATAAYHRGDTAAVVSGISWTAALGTCFLLVQGIEWVRLIAHGLTLGSTVYGGTFYVLIGCHALHVLVAVGWLLGVALVLRRGIGLRDAVEACGLYWYFVCALWAGLFPLVYLY
jgi:cytochrome c oxidase subunit III